MDNLYNQAAPESALRFDDGKLELSHIHPAAWDELMTSTGVPWHLLLQSRLMDGWFYYRKSALRLETLNIGEMARVLAHGAQKYGSLNYAKGMAYSRVMNSFRRHLLAIASGVLRDKESGLSHEGHMACNMMFAYVYTTERIGTDNRPNLGNDQ